MGAFFIRLVSLLWIVVGFFGLLATKKSVSALNKFCSNANRQSLGLVSLIFGVLLLVASSATKAVWFVMALAIMSCLKGTAVILMPKQKINAIFEWWFSAPEIVYKGWAILMLLLGIAMLSSI